MASPLDDEEDVVEVGADKTEEADGEDDEEFAFKLPMRASS